MTSPIWTSDDRMAHYLRRGRRLHGEAVVAALKLVGRAIAKSVAGLFAHRGRHTHNPA